VKKIKVKKYRYQSWAVDHDYWKKLNQAEAQWLRQFDQEYYWKCLYQIGEKNSLHREQFKKWYKELNDSDYSRSTDILNVKIVEDIMDKVGKIQLEEVEEDILKYGSRDEAIKQLFESTIKQIQTNKDTTRCLCLFYKKLKRILTAKNR